MEDDTNRGFFVCLLRQQLQQYIQTIIQIIVMTLICKELRWMKSTRPNALQK